MILSEFKTGTYTRTVGQSSDPALAPIFDKLNELADVLEAKKEILEPKLRLVFDTMADGVVIQNSKGEIVDFNPAALSILGLSADQLRGRTSLDPKWKSLREDGTAFPGADHPAVVARLTGKKVLGTIMGLQLPTGENSWIRINATPYEVNGCPENGAYSERNVLVTFSDITEVKRQENKVQESEYFTSVIANNIPGLVGYWTRDLRCSFSNSEYLNWFGRTAEEMKNIHIRDLLGDEHFSKNEPYMLAVLNGENQEFEREIVKRNGKMVTTWTQFLAHRVNGEVVGFFVLATDISLMKQAAQQMIQTAKLVSLGEMAAGMAHEINNPLAIISGLVELLPKYVDNPEKFFIKTEAIMRATKRINKIVGGLQKFSHSNERNNHSLRNLSKIVSEAILLTESKSKQHDVIITYDLGPELLIQCNEIEIEQVAINLISNAVDAIRDREERWVKLEVFSELKSIVLRVTDSGSGIPDTVVDKIFDPFFTTKNVGEGTGLGLSITKGILDEHKATISIIAHCPNTCFEIRFPVLEKTNKVSTIS